MDFLPQHHEQLTISEVRSAIRDTPEFLRLREYLRDFTRECVKDGVSICMWTREDIDLYVYTSRVNDQNSSRNNLLDLYWFKNDENLWSHSRDKTIDDSQDTIFWFDFERKDYGYRAFWTYSFVDYWVVWDRSWDRPISLNPFIWTYSEWKNIFLWQNYNTSFYTEIISDAWNNSFRTGYSLEDEFNNISLLANINENHEYVWLWYSYNNWELSISTNLNVHLNQSQIDPSISVNYLLNDTLLYSSYETCLEWNVRAEIWVVREVYEDIFFQAAYNSDTWYMFWLNWKF